MKRLTLRLLEDHVPPGGDPVFLPATVRALYLVEGDATVETALGCAHHDQGSAWIGDSAVAVLPGGQGARMLRWELVAPSDDDGVLRVAPKCSSAVASVATVELDPGFGWMMRCDRVSFPKGGIAYTHVHQGPGIRYCLEGSIRIETEGHVSSYAPGEAWFESGASPVLAPTSPDMETSFVRCFILPRSCKGRSSIRYVRPEDAAKPKLQRYRVLGERIIELPPV
jgi:quercetin dioxygenase-like cupin family protein